MVFYRKTYWSGIAFLADFALQLKTIIDYRNCRHNNSNDVITGSPLLPSLPRSPLIPGGPWSPAGPIGPGGPGAPITFNTPQIKENVSN